MAELNSDYAELEQIGRFEEPAELEEIIEIDESKIESVPDEGFIDPKPNPFEEDLLVDETTLDELQLRCRVFKQLRKMTAEYFNISETKIDLQTDFKRDFGATDLELDEFAFCLDEEFYIIVPEQVFRNTSKFGVLLTYIYSEVEQLRIV